MCKYCNRKFDENELVFNKLLPYQKYDISEKVLNFYSEMIKYHGTFANIFFDVKTIIRGGKFMVALDSAAGQREFNKTFRPIPTKD